MMLIRSFTTAFRQVPFDRRYIWYAVAIVCIYMLGSKILDRGITSKEGVSKNQPLSWKQRKELAADVSGSNGACKFVSNSPARLVDDRGRVCTWENVDENG